jgi:hypothetical protein
MAGCAGSYVDTPYVGRYADSPYVGLYKFENKHVWIRIAADGTAYQCRIGKTGRVFRSEGKLRRGDEIHWKRKIWGIDSISLDGTGIRLSGELGSWSYQPQPVDDVDDRCRATIFPSEPAEQ